MNKENKINWYLDANEKKFTGEGIYILESRNSIALYYMNIDYIGDIEVIRAEKHNSGPEIIFFQPDSVQICGKIAKKNHYGEHIPDHGKRTLDYAK